MLANVNNANRQQDREDQKNKTQTHTLTHAHTFPNRIGWSILNGTSTSTNCRQLQNSLRKVFKLKSVTGFDYKSWTSSITTWINNLYMCQARHTQPIYQLDCQSAKLDATLTLPTKSTWLYRQCIVFANRLLRTQSTRAQLKERIHLDSWLAVWLHGWLDGWQMEERDGRILWRAFCHWHIFSLSMLPLFSTSSTYLIGTG